MDTSNSSIDKADESIIDNTDEEMNDAVAESSPADEPDAKPEKPESMFDAVKSALDAENEPEQQETAESSNAKKEGEEGSEETPERAEEEGSDDGGQESDEQLPFHKDPHWQQVINENKQLKEKAQQHDDLMSYMNDSGLEPEDIDQGVELMRLLRHDPEKAAEALLPVIEYLQPLTGKGNLPDDLQQAVNNGMMTEDYAREVATLRVKSEVANRKAQAVEETHNKRQQQWQQQQLQEQQSVVKRSVDAWEKTWKNSDPDYERKQPLVQSRVIELVRERGMPRSDEEAIKLSEEAKADVEKRLTAFTSTKPEKRTVTGGKSVATTPKPANLREVVEQAVKRD